MVNFLRHRIQHMRLTYISKFQFYWIYHGLLVYLKKKVWSNSYDMFGEGKGEHTEKARPERVCSATTYGQAPQRTSLTVQPNRILTPANHFVKLPQSITKGKKITH